MANYQSFADSYTAGLRDVLADGNDVDSVRDPLSKASGFGQNDRPYRELLAYQSRIADPTSCLAVTPHLPVNLSYCFGLLAWSLDGRNDVDTPAYYRRGAHEYSDDQHTLSGAFGHRLLTSRGTSWRKWSAGSSATPPTGVRSPWCCSPRTISASRGSTRAPWASTSSSGTARSPGSPSCEPSRR